MWFHCVFCFFKFPSNHWRKTNMYYFIFFSALHFSEPQRMTTHTRPHTLLLHLVYKSTSTIIITTEKMEFCNDGYKLRRKKIVMYYWNNMCLYTITYIVNCFPPHTDRWKKIYIISTTKQQQQQQLAVTIPQTKLSVTKNVGKAQ
jgi:hypothetical protein